MEFSSFRDWFSYREIAQNLIIAGPCSAESFDQLEEIFKVATDEQRWNVIRIGIWKPRSRPDSFDGNEASLHWIKELKSIYKLPVMVEVANPRHVELALKFGIDAFWIGARTVGLPFAVEEIAQSMRGLNVPVCIKNPVGPDVSLWRGAVERFQKVGINKLGIIHRGFSWHYGQKLRNWPLWSLVVQMKSYFPGITVIGDPSHMAGLKSLVPMIAQDCISFGCDGLMVETHPEPEKALSDPLQQIPLAEFSSFLNNLKYPKVKGTTTELEFFRMQIDEIDQKIVQLLKSREDITSQIANMKIKEQLQVVDYQRFNEMLQTRKLWYADPEGEEFIEKIFHLIHEKSIQHQLSIFDK